MIIKTSPLSTRRKILKVTGVTLTVIGVIALIFMLTMQPSNYYFLLKGQPIEEGEVRGSTRYYQAAVGVIGLALIYVGYRTYKFIPYSEREREYISEENL